MASFEGRDPYDDYVKINEKLRLYNEKLLLRPQIVVANKMDLAGAKENLEEFKKKLPDVLVVPISAYTKSNLDELLYKIGDILETVSLDEFIKNYK